MKKAASKAKSKATSRKVSRPTMTKAAAPSRPATQVPAHEKHLPMMSAAVLVLGVLVAIAAVVLLKFSHEVNNRYFEQLEAETRYQHELKMMMIDRMKAKMDAETSPTPAPKTGTSVKPAPMMKRY
jgi:hypothetical protein